MHIYIHAYTHAYYTCRRQNKKTKIRGYMEDPFIFLDRKDDMFDPIM